MHFDTPTRQRWMAALAHATPVLLQEKMHFLELQPEYELVRPPQIGLVQIQARMGGTGDRFFPGDATITRATVRLASGTAGFSWVIGRNMAHAERCAVCDALLQEPAWFTLLMDSLIAPLEADRATRLETRRAEINASRVDFFTLVRGEDA
ncbi:phosphonate C-P lyase system protein PhnG [Salmonella enterica]